MGRIKPAALLRQSKRQKGPSRPSVTTIAACNFLLVMILLSIVFISKQRGKQGKIHHDVSEKSTEEAELSYQYAVLNTSEGLVTLRLYGQQSPKTVENFVTRSQNGYYNGEKFYRVIDGFMIQGRDEGSNGTDGSSLRDVNFNDELDADQKYDPFTVTLENLEPHRLFIATVGTPHLKKHTAIGSVVHGQKVLQDMANHPADLSDPLLNQGNFDLIRDMIHQLHPEENWWRMSCTYNMGVQLFNVKQYRENQSIVHDTAEQEVRSLSSFICDIEPPLVPGIIGLLLEEDIALKDKAIRTDCWLGKAARSCLLDHGDLFF